ncbi:DUF397 domain-containing protein [Spirillospora sp. NPDC077959]|uniref:DUF397 domain-containing protein n=1 Tax=Spirillospora sp. NPDC077959 TaxID=3364529 RepID=UPI0037D829DE
MGGFRAEGQGGGIRPPGPLITTRRCGVHSLVVTLTTWRKSLRSGQNGNCVEIARVADSVEWRKSSHSKVRAVPASRSPT